MGAATTFLGYKVDRDRAAGTLTLSCPGRTVALLDQFGLEAARGGRPQLLVGGGAGGGASGWRRLAAAGVGVGGRWVGWLAATQGDYAPLLWERGILPSYKRV